MKQLIQRSCIHFVLTWIAQQLPEDAQVVLFPVLLIGSVHVRQRLVDNLADDLEEGVLVLDQVGKRRGAVGRQVLPQGQAVHGVVRRGLRQETVTFSRVLY